MNKKIKENKKIKKDKKNNKDKKEKKNKNSKVTEETKIVETVSEKETTKVKSKKKRFKLSTKFKLILYLIFFIFIMLGIYFGLSYMKWQKLAFLVLNNEPSTVYNQKNEEIVKIGNEKKQENVTFSEVPENLVDAYVSIEDQRYYTHYGIKWGCWFLTLNI